MAQKQSSDENITGGNIFEPLLESSLLENPPDGRNGGCHSGEDLTSLTMVHLLSPDVSFSKYAEEEEQIESQDSSETHKTDYSAEIKFPVKNESDTQSSGSGDAKSSPLVHHNDADISKEREPEEETFLERVDGEDGAPVAPVRKTRRRSKELNESSHAEATNSSHETETRLSGDRNTPNIVESSEHRSLEADDNSSKEEIINEAMSEEVEWALGQKREAASQIQRESGDLKDTNHCDDHQDDLRSTIKTDAEKSGDLLEKERQRKISEENAKAEKLRLGNLMRMVQEKIDKARMEKEKRLANKLERVEK